MGMRRDRVLLDPEHCRESTIVDLPLQYRWCEAYPKDPACSKDHGPNTSPVDDVMGIRSVSILRTG